MPQWVPEPFWTGQDVYIIGGGPSLQTFDWDRLRGKHTIGCNSAYRLGKEVCLVCFFGDRGFWNEHKEALASYTGTVVTNSKVEDARHPDPEWLYRIERRAKGVFLDVPGWNGNSGACAVNLALIFGAKRVMLLGYDMKATKDTANWYRPGVKKKDIPYARFLQAFDRVAKGCREMFPDRVILNVNDDSALKAFPTVPVEVFFKEEQK